MGLVSLLRLDGGSKQFSNESGMAEAVAPARSLHLSFLSHIYHLISLECLLCCLKSKEAPEVVDA